MQSYRKINFPHGIMFHHFHDNKKHKKSQGSLPAKILKKIIKRFGKKNILDAQVFHKKFIENNLKKNHMCLTFDDGIKSQIDIALPILKKYKIKAFFFIYSSILTNKPDNLEIYRYFRCNHFDNIDKFYQMFFDEVKINLNKFFNNKRKKIFRMKKIFSYYSINDIKFRILRDDLLTKKQYDQIMKNLFKKKNFQPKKFFYKIFMSKRDIKKLISEGHSIGLHSHSHPTNLKKLTRQEQLNEYKRNKSTLYKFTKNIYSMSHPCGSYNKSTLKLLNKIGIEIGFKQHLFIEKNLGMKKINNSNLEIARRDSSDFLKNT
jgi:peptidoglycan/xylan/chitin deacetylase (PgdA/CDA1 family)